MEAVDYTLQDLLDSSRSFGDIVGGVFRQILSVVEKGSRDGVVDACTQHPYLWRHMQIFHLTQSMQLGQSL